MQTTELKNKITHLIHAGLSQLDRAISKVEALPQRKLWVAFLIALILMIFAEEHRRENAQDKDNESNKHSYLSGADAPSTAAPHENDQFSSATADTYIPPGYVLVPLEIQNGEALESIMGEYGTVDLLNHQPEQKRSRTLAENVRLIRAPNNRHLFAALVPSEHAALLVQRSGGVWAVIKNPNEATKSETRFFKTDGADELYKFSSDASKNIMEANHDTMMANKITRRTPRSRVRTRTLSRLRFFSDLEDRNLDKNSISEEIDIETAPPAHTLE